MPVDTHTLLLLLASFLIGSIPFAVVAMWGSGVDIRTIGSGNPGFNNVLRVSWRRSLISLFGDVGKGFVPVWLFHGAGDPVNLAWLYGMGAVFGHCYSPFLRFRGGKGIATSAGAMLAIYPSLAVWALAFFVVFRVLAAKFKVNEGGAWSSMLSWVFFTGFIHWQLGLPHSKYSLLMTVFLVWLHRSNIVRIVRGAAPGTA